MIGQVVEAGLVALSFVTALNTWLILRLAKNSDARAEPVQPGVTATVGQAVPAFVVELLSDGRALNSTSLAGQPFVLAFVSAGCPKCRDKLAQLAGIVEVAESAGLKVLVVGMSPPGEIRRLLQNPVLSILLQRAAIMDSTTTLKSLNPVRMSPFYLMVDQQGVIQAKGIMGDLDWQSFVEQMSEIKASQAA